MLSRFNPIDIEDALRAASPPPPFPSASDRAAWAEVAATLGPTEVAAIITEAEADAQRPLQPLPATLYLEFLRNGQREGYQQPANERRDALRSLTLAECLEGQGRFLDPLMNVAWAICEESSWSWPAHQHILTDLDHSIVDLNAAMTALALAEMNALVGAQLDPLISKRIHDEIERRDFTPYLTRHDHWWLYNSHSRRVNNWTAVCNAGVVGAAIYLEKDLARLAEMIARAARSLDDYLECFDEDGGSSEGPGYWSYGFGYFTILAHLIEQRTAGKISVFAGDHIAKIARFPLHVSLSPGIYANFSDADRRFSFIPAHLAYLSQRLDIPDLEARLAHTQRLNRYELQWGLRTLFWRPDPALAQPLVPAKHDWYGGMTWMFARVDPANPDALVLAAKGGHNGEMHNQNDVGNFIVHLNQESVIADVGRGRYTRFYFGPERYDHFVNSSIGHSVPVPNGQVQHVGPEFASQLLDYTANDSVDNLRTELKGAYPSAADLASLERTVVLHRDTPQGWVEVVDTAKFATEPGTLESALTTFGQVETDAACVILHGERGALRVTFDPAVITPRVELVKDVDLSEGYHDVNRVVFAAAPAREATIRLKIEPL